MLLNMERNKVHYKHLIPFFYRKGKNGIQVANKMAHKRCSWNYTSLSTAYLWVISSMFIHMYFLYVLYIYISLFFYVFNMFLHIFFYAFIYFLYLCFVYVILLCSPTCIFTSVLTVLCIYIYISVIEIQYGILVFSTEIFFFLISRVLYAAYVRILLIMTMIVYDHSYQFEIILSFYKDILFFVFFIWLQYMLIFYLLYVYLLVFVYIDLYVCIFIFIFIYLYMYIYLFVYVYLLVFIYV